VQNFSEGILLFASSLRKNHLFSFWDSLILSAALEANSDYVVREDMQHNRLLNNNLKIINPFL
jgi:predicted nucleic acid-binding protein